MLLLFVCWYNATLGHRRVDAAALCPVNALSRENARMWKAQLWGGGQLGYRRWLVVRALVARNMHDGRRPPIEKWKRVIKGGTGMVVGWGKHAEEIMLLGYFCLLASLENGRALWSCARLSLFLAVHPFLPSLFFFKGLFCSMRSQILSSPLSPICVHPVLVVSWYHMGDDYFIRNFIEAIAFLLLFGCSNIHYLDNTISSSNWCPDYLVGEEDHLAPKYSQIEASASLSPDTSI